MRRGSEAQKSEWLARSWQGGEADPLTLCELRTRADAYLAIEETAYERWCELHGVDPVTE